MFEIMNWLCSNTWWYLFPTLRLRGFLTNFVQRLWSCESIHLQFVSSFWVWLHYNLLVFSPYLTAICFRIVAPSSTFARTANRISDRPDLWSPKKCCKSSPRPASTPKTDAKKNISRSTFDFHFLLTDFIQMVTSRFLIEN